VTDDDHAVDDQAVEDQAVEDQAVEDQAVEDQAVEDQAIDDQAVDEQSNVDGPSPKRWCAVVCWLALLVGAIALDGWVGGVVAVVVAVVLAARLSPRVLGALGVVAIFGSLVAVLVDGVPSPSEVSPAFVSRSLLPHHLMFAGLVWVGAWAVLDLVPHLVAHGDLADAPGEPTPSVVERRLAVGIVVVVGLALAVASWAVLQA